MAYTIRFTPSANEDLEWFTRREQQIIVHDVKLLLRHEPGQVSTRRKRLKPNRLAEWELRIGDFRVFSISKRM